MNPWLRGAPFQLMNQSGYSAMSQSSAWAAFVFGKLRIGVWQRLWDDWPRHRQAHDVEHNASWSRRVIGAIQHKTSPVTILSCKFYNTERRRSKIITKKILKPQTFFTKKGSHETAEEGKTSQDHNSKKTLIALYEAWNKPEEANEWRAKLTQIEAKTEWHNATKIAQF